MSALPIPQATSDNQAERTYRKVTLRLIPFLFLCYLAAYLDRVNVGFAKLQMLANLQLSETIYGLGAGIFFLGYFLFEIPSNITLQRVGPRRWIARIMLTWGALSAAMVWIDTPTMYYVLRFLLGVAEAGFFPGIILYLTYWYPQDRHGRVVAWFMTAVALSGMVGGPLSGWIMGSFAGVAGLHNWQWLFLLEGIPSVLIGIVTFFYLDDSIREARWLDAGEKAFLQQQVDKDNAHKVHLSIASVFTNSQVWLFCAIYFMFVMGLYGVSFWLPNLLRNAGVRDVVDVGLISAIPYAAAAAGMVLVGRSSDRTGDRHWHLAVCGIAGAAGFWMSSAYGDNLYLALTGITIATISIMSTLSLFWTLPTGYLVGTAAAAGIAMINSVGNLAGFVSPFVVGWIKDRTHSLTGGLFMLALCFVAGSVLCLLAKKLRRQASPARMGS